MKIWKSLLTALLCGMVCASAWAAQQKSSSSAKSSQKAAKAEAVQPESPEVKALHERSDAFYGAILKGDNAAAQQFVAADSQENFNHLDLKSMETSKFISASIDGSGNTAVVRTARTYRAPIGIGMAFDDTWKKVDGQWQLTIPATDYGALFGIPKSTQTAAPNAQELQKQIDVQTTINNDPDQVYRRLREIQEQEKQKKAAEAAAAQPQTAAPEQPAPGKSKKKSKKNADDVKANSMTSPSTPPQM